MPASEIHVCHAGTCLARGAEAVLTEIEELVNQVGGGCAVRRSGCLGYCNEAPNAVVLERGTQRLDPSRVHVRIRSLEASAKVVQAATGARPALTNSARLEGLRAARARQHAIAVCKWNLALRGLAEEAAERPALRSELRALLDKAGFPEGVGSVPEAGEVSMPSVVDNYSPWSVESVTPVTRHSCVLHLVSKNRKRGTPHPRGGGRMLEPNTWHTTLLAQVGPNAEGPLPWVERDYTPISTAREWDQGKCSLLVKVYADGAATSWLHRERPARLLLSKPARTLLVPALVPDGRAFRPASVLLLLAGTGVVALPQLLAHREPTRELGVATPQRDQLRVPMDVVLSYRDDDVLLLPQLAHWCREGGEARGVRALTLLLTPAATPPEPHTPPPAELPPAAPPPAELPAAALLAAPPAALSAAPSTAPPDAPPAVPARPHARGAPPFPAAQGGDGAEAERLLHDLANARILRERLSIDIVSDALARMPHPCRVLVSGPATFNTAARGMLTELALDLEAQVTILSA